MSLLCPVSRNPTRGLDENLTDNLGVGPRRTFSPECVGEAARPLKAGFLVGLLRADTDPDRLLLSVRRFITICVNQIRIR